MEFVISTKKGVMMMMDINAWHVNLRPKAVEWKGQKFHWIQEKLDGYRLTILKESNGRIWAKGRQEDYWLDLKRVKHIAEKVLELPPNTMIDGELYWPGHYCSEVVTAIKYREEGLRFTAFSMPFIDGTDLRNVTLDVVERIVKTRTGFNFVPTEYVLDKCSEKDLPPNTEWLPFLQRLLLQARDRRVEGYVLKLHHWDAWYKVKPLKTVDCFVREWESGTPGHKYADGLGALYCSVLDGSQIIDVCKVSGGLKDVDRLPFDEERFQKEWFNQVVEIAYQDVLSGGRLQHPRLIRKRDDKIKSECLINQLDRSRTR